MESLTKSQFIEFSYDAENNLLETIWATTTLMGQDAYRETVELYLAKVQEYKPKGVVMDTLKSEYVVIPEDQDWINTQILPKAAEAGLEKVAILIGTDLFLNISFEQVLEDSKANVAVAQQINQQFFDNYDKAKAWLLA